MNTRRPTQVVWNLAEAQEETTYYEIDVRSSRLNSLTEAIVEDTPIFNAFEELDKAHEAGLCDHMCVDIGHVRNSPKNRIDEGPRWYDTATVKFM